MGVRGIFRIGQPLSYPLGSGSVHWSAVRHDVLSGLVTAIATIASSIGYAVLIFSGPLEAHMDFAVAYGLVSAAVIAVVFVVSGSFPFAIAGPDSKPTSVLSAFGLSLAGAVAVLPEAQQGPTLIGGMILTTVICGGALMAMGWLRLGRWIRYVPYPIIGGFLAASGWLLVFGAGRMSTRTSTFMELVGTSTNGSIPGPLIVTLLAAMGFYLVGRFFKSVAALPVAIGAMSVGLVLGLQGAGIEIAEAQQTGWLLSLSAGGVMQPAWDMSLWQDVHWPSLLTTSAEIAVVAGVSAITILLSTSAVELVSRSDADVDRELRTSGLANLLSGALGGMIGVLSLSRTLLNYENGGRGRLAGLTVGLASAATLLFGTEALTYVPIPVLAGLILRLGAGLVYEWMVETFRRLTLHDYLQILIIQVIILRYGFLEGVGAGLLIACVTFAVNFSRIPLVRLNLTRADFSSNVERPLGAVEQLTRSGDAIQIFWLHGFIFFGSAINLFHDVKKRIDERPGKVRTVVLEFKSVLGIDSSAEASFRKLIQLAEREGIVVAFATMPSAVCESLESSGLLRGNDHCRIFDTLDAALEACEEEFLTEDGNGSASNEEADAWLTEMLGNSDLFERFTRYLTSHDIDEGEYLFRQGDAADSLYIVRSGRVSVLYEQDGMPDLRLRSMLGRTMVGEIGLYRANPRGASVKADVATSVYRLAHTDMERLHAENPDVALAFHMFVVRTTAERLDFANRELAALSR